MHYFLLFLSIIFCNVLSVEEEFAPLPLIKIPTDFNHDDSNQLISRNNEVDTSLIEQQRNTQLEQMGVVAYWPQNLTNNDIDSVAQGVLQKLGSDLIKTPLVLIDVDGINYLIKKEQYVAENTYERDPNYCPILAAELSDAFIASLNRQAQQENINKLLLESQLGQIHYENNHTQVNIEQAIQNIEKDLESVQVSQSKELIGTYQQDQQISSNNVLNYKYLDLVFRNLFEHSLRDQNGRLIDMDPFLVDFIQTDRAIQDHNSPLTKIVKYLEENTYTTTLKLKDQQPSNNLVSSTFNWLVYTGKTALLNKRFTVYEEQSYLDQLAQKHSRRDLYSFHAENRNQILCNPLIRQRAEALGFNDWRALETDIDRIESIIKSHIEQEPTTTKQFISQYEVSVADRQSAQKLEAYNKNFTLTISELQKFYDVLIELKDDVSQRRMNGLQNIKDSDVITVDFSLRARKEELILDYLIIKTENALTILQACRNINNIRLSTHQTHTKRIVGASEVVTKAAVNVIQHERTVGQNWQNAITNFNDQPAVRKKPVFDEQFSKLCQEFSTTQHQEIRTIFSQSQQQFFERSTALWGKKVREQIIQGPDFYKSERLQAIAHTERTSGARLLIDMPQVSSTQMKELGISAQDLTTPRNAIQCQLFKENVQLSEKIDYIRHLSSNDPQIKRYTDLIVTLSKQAIAANKQGDISTSCKLTNLVHQYTDIAYELASNVAQKLVDHAPELLAAGGVAATAVAVTELAPVLATYGAGRGTMAVVSMLASSAQKQTVPTTTKALASALIGRTVTKVAPKNEEPKLITDGSEQGSRLFDEKKVLKNPPPHIQRELERATAVAGGAGAPPPGDPRDPRNRKNNFENKNERKQNTYNEQLDFIKEIQKNGYVHAKQYDAYKFIDEKGNKFNPIHPGAIYASKDRLHFEIELFDKNGNHLGSIDPVTREWLKSAVPGRNLFEQAKK